MRILPKISNDRPWGMALNQKIQLQSDVWIAGIAFDLRQSRAEKGRPGNPPNRSGNGDGLQVDATGKCLVRTSNEFRTWFEDELVHIIRIIPAIPPKDPGANTFNSARNAHRFAQTVLSRDDCSESIRSAVGLESISDGKERPVKFAVSQLCDSCGGSSRLLGLLADCVERTRRTSHCRLDQDRRPFDARIQL
jgi:hypothetical protein